MSIGLLVNRMSINSHVSSRELIVRVLCDEWPLTIRQIHERIERAYGFECTYQAVFNQVKEMSESSIVCSNGKHYKLNEKWLEGVNEFVEVLLEHYQRNPRGIIGPIVAGQETEKPAKSLPLNT